MTMGSLSELIRNLEHLNAIGEDIRDQQTMWAILFSNGGGKAIYHLSDEEYRLLVNDILTDEYNQPAPVPGEDGAM